MWIETAAVPRQNSEHLLNQAVKGVHSEPRVRCENGTMTRFVDAAFDIGCSPLSIPPRPCPREPGSAATACAPDWNVTRYPTAGWVSQQLREAFPYDSAPRFLILDREHTFHGEVLETMKGLGIVPVRTAVRSPWQNGIAERFVGNCRRDLLDQVIVLNGRHLKQLMAEYVHYYHDDRTHLGLGKIVLREHFNRSFVNEKCIPKMR